MDMPKPWVLVAIAVGVYLVFFRTANREDAELITEESGTQPGPAGNLPALGGAAFGGASSSATVEGVSSNVTPSQMPPPAPYRPTLGAGAAKAVSKSGGTFTTANQNVFSSNTRRVAA